MTYRISTDHFQTENGERYVATAWTIDGFFGETSDQWSSEYQAIADAEYRVEQAVKADAERRSQPVVEAEPVKAPIIAGIEKEIKFCRATRDYDLYVTIDGGEPQYIGSASTYGQGEVITNQWAYDYLMDSQTIETAAELLMELPVSAFCATCGNEGDCPDCSPRCATCGGEGDCPDCEPKAEPIRIRVQRGAEIVHQSTGKTADAPHAFMVLATRDQDSGCMLFAMPSRGLCYVAEGWVTV